MKKRKSLAAAIVIFLLAAALPVFAGGLVKATSKNPEAQKLIDKAWELENTDATAEIFKQCFVWMEEADRLDPNNPEILVDLSRYYWEHGDLLPKQTPEQKKGLIELYSKGLKAAEKSLKLKETSGAHFWCAVSKGAIKEFSSILAQAGAFPYLYRHTQYVLKHDMGYDYGAAGRLWSEIVSRVPKILVIMTGERYVAEVEQGINRAIKEWPCVVDNHLYKARFIYTYYGDKEAALKLLETVMKTDPNCMPEVAVRIRVTHRYGRELWKTITGKEYPER